MTLMTDRKFGVELEFGITCVGSCKGKNCGYNEYGNGTPQLCETGEERLEFALERVTGPRGIGKHWNDSMHGDGTMIEISSPILRGVKGMSEVERVMRLVRRVGGFTTEEDGLHVHHDAPEFIKDSEAVLRLVESWNGNITQVRKVIDKERAEISEDQYSPCPAWDDHSLEELRSDITSGHFPKNLRSGHQRRGYGYSLYKFGRRDLNIMPLTEHGTIEFRLLEGTLDFQKLRAWIRLGQALLHKATQSKEPVAEKQSLDELFKEVKLRSVWGNVLLDAAQA